MEINKMKQPAVDHVDVINSQGDVYQTFSTIKEANEWKMNTILKELRTYEQQHPDETADTYELAEQIITDNLHTIPYSALGESLPLGW